MTDQNRIRLYPKPGLALRDPTTRELIDEGGIEVAAANGEPVDRFWLRRLRDGDASKDDPRTSAAVEHGVVPESADDAEPSEHAEEE